MSGKNSYLSLKYMAIVAAVFSTIAGLLVLIGWQFDIAILKSPLTGTISMKANTAACFFVAGLSLILLQITRPIINTLVRFCGLAILMVGLLTFCEYIFSWNAGIDEILFRDAKDAIATIYPGRIAPNAALNFLLIGFAFFLLTFQRFINSFLMEFPLVFSLTISILGFIGYSTGLVELSGLASYTKMAFHTAGTFIILCIGMIFTVYERQRSPITFEQKLFAGITISATIIIFVSSLFISSIHSMHEAADLVQHTVQVKKQINEMHSSVINVETGVRGYLLTGNEVYLEPMENASNKITEQLTNLRHLSKDNPFQQNILNILDPLIKKRVEVAEQLYNTFKSAGIKEAISLLETGKGEILSDSIRTITEQMIAEEDRLLKIHDKAEDERSAQTQTITVLGFVFNISLLALMFVFVRNDVSGRRKAEEALREKSEELDRYFTHTLDLLCIADMDGYFRRLNKSWESTLGYSLQDLEGKPFLDLVHPDDIEATLAAMADLSKSKEVINFTNRYRCRDGSYRWIEWRSVPAGKLIYAAAHDITEKKRAEEVLSLQKKIAEIFLTFPDDEMFYEVLKVILEIVQSPFGVFGFIDKDGALVVPTMTRHIWDKCQIPEKTNIFPRDIWGDSSWPRAIREKKLNYSNEISHKTPEGHITVNRHISYPILYQEEVIGLFQVANRENDYTEADIKTLEIIARYVAPVLNARLQRQRREEEIRQINAKLDAANKELDAFSYSVSHDLRAPLRAVTGFSDKLLRNYADRLDEEGKRLINIITNNSLKMGTLIDDLLSFSRLGRKEIIRSHIDMEKLALDTFNEITSEKEKSKIKFNLKKVPPAHGDQPMLKQVFSNLLSNAIKFCRNNPMAVVEIGCDKGIDENIYFVKDNGAGFNMQYADKLFGVFQRLHSEKEFEGTGIGLSLVQRIIHKHGGRVWAKGKEKKGATFYFSLQNKEITKNEL